MQVKEWVAEIINPIRTLSNLDLLLDMQDVTTSHQKSLIRLSFPYFVSEGDIRYSKLAFGAIEEYMEFLRNRLYSALLFDGSFLQISMDVHKAKIIRYRYGYYPCPIKFVGNELSIMTMEESIADIIDTFISGQRKDILLRTPVRFDFDSNEWKPDEPHAHVHFNHPECRCALSAPIYPSYFIKFIMKYFYPDLWYRHQELELLDQEIAGYWLRNDEKNFLHLTAKNIMNGDAVRLLS